MEPPPPSLSSATTSSIPPPPPHVPASYPKSTTDACEDIASSKLRVMCSYNGHILPRPHDKSLCYMGGDTRIISLDRNSSLSSLLARLSNTLLNGHTSFTLKYQLPSEDLDSLISVTTDEDLDNMIEEYDRTLITSAKPSRLRLFLFASKQPEATQSMGQILESHDWFVDALNRGFSDSDSDVNTGKQLKQQPPQQQGGQQDVPDSSPLLDTSSSSFGSTSSSPSLAANLPPIRVHAEEARDQRLGIEEQLARFNVESKIQDDGFAAMPMPVTTSLPAAPANAATVSDEERSDHGVGYRKPPTPRSQPLNQQVKSNSGGHEMPSPDSVSSESSMNNSVFQQRPSLYQEPVSQMPSSSTVVTGLINPSDPSTLLSHNQNQNQDSGYILHPAQSQPPQQQQFIHAPQYLHHHPSTRLPVQSYIQVYPSQHQHQQQQSYPFYYVTSPVPSKPYNIPVTQSVSVTDYLRSLPSTSTMMAPPPNSHLRNTPEAGVQTTTQQGMGGAQVVHQVPISQQQFMGYSQIHHPPQSGSAGISNYGYEYAENAPKQVFYTQHMGHAQYQTMTGPPPAMVLPDGSTVAAKLPAENLTQQMRTSQPL